uniref:Uncharacterized protein n=1 Tax=viral metagenome TaxID=1070528 RepID=A0A6M3L5B1_9ZZZZ
MKKLYLISTILILTFVLSGCETPLGGRTPVDPWTKDGTGANISGAVVINGVLTQGGGVRATSTVNATETLLYTDFDTENVIDYTANINTTLTLPATSTMSAMIPIAGEMREIIFRSATTTAAATITLVAGAGMDLQFDEGAGDLVLLGLDVGTLKFIRKTNTDMIVLWQEYAEAD